MKTKVLNIGHRETMRLKNVQGLAECGCVRTRKDSLPDPSAEIALVASANKMEQAPPRVPNRSMNKVTQAIVVTDADVLQHPDGHEHIELPGNVAAVLFDELHFVAKAGIGCPGACVENLRMRDIKRLDAYAVFSGHVERERTPSTTCFDDA